MKYAALLLLLAPFASCKESWSDEHKQAFTRTCLEGAAAQGMTELSARAYCECALDKTSKRYATIAEVVENKDSTALTQDLEICRRSTR